MTIIPLTDCCAMLGIDPKTLRHWLKLTSMQFAPHPTDARLKCLTLSHIQQLATLPDRPLPFSVSAPPALQETAPVPGLIGEHAQASPESQAQLVQTTPLLSPSVSEEAISASGCPAWKVPDQHAGATVPTCTRIAPGAVPAL